MNRPPKSILDPDFKYVPSGKCNIRKTFDRIRKQMRQETEADQLAALKENVAAIHQLKRSNKK